MPDKIKFGKSLLNKTTTKKIENHLGEKQAQLSSNCNAVGKDFFIALRTKEDGSITWINRYGETFLGQKSEEILGQSILKIVFPGSSIADENQDRAIKYFLLSTETTDVAEFETKNGSGRYIRIAWMRNHLQQNGKNVPEIQYIGIPVRNRQAGKEFVSPESKMEKTVCSSGKLDDEVPSQKYDLLEKYIQGMSGWAWETGPDTRFCYISRSVERVLGYSPEELLGFSLHDIIEDTSKEGLDTLFASAGKGVKDCFNFKGQFRCKDGKKIWAEMGVVVSRAENGMLSGIKGLCRDLSKDISAEQEICTREQEYRYLFDNTQVALFVKDEEGVIKNINQTGAAIYGRSPEEMIGRIFTEFISEEIREKAFNGFSEIYQRAKLQKTKFVDSPPYLVRLETPKGIRYLRNLPKAIKVVENGQMIALMQTGLDETESQMLREKLEKHQRKLKRIVADRTKKIKALQDDLIRNERLEALGRLTSKVSHEIRNPLGTINSSLYIIKERLKGKEIGVFSAIDRGFRAVRRCDGIIEEMLDFTRTKGLEKRTVNVSGWFEKIVDGTKLPENVTIVKKIEDGLSAPIDLNRLHRCISNIIENCLEAMDADSGGNITAGIWAQNGYLKISIEDTGRGIPKNEQKKVFDPLYSTKNNGIGMGLPVSKKVMELHGGTIRISSEIDKGTTVVLRLSAS